MMDKLSDIKLESIYIAWCESLGDPSGKGILPFEAFKKGFRQGVLFADQPDTRYDGFPISGTWFGKKEKE